MSIKQNGGVFGRNPTFNDVTIEGQLTFDGDIDINSDLKVDGNLDVDGTVTMDGGSTSADFNFSDEKKALFGNGNDLKIYHSANNQSYIHETGTGDLNILATNLKLQDASGSTKMSTTSSGISVNGIASVTGSNKHALTIKSNVGSGSYEVGRNQSTGVLEFKGTEATYNGYLFKGPSSDLMEITAAGTATMDGLVVDGGSAGNTGIANCDVQITRNRVSSIGLRSLSNGEVIRFVHTATDVGSIDITTSATSYNTSSDYRLKEDVQPMSGATDRLKELKPVNFAWKADGSRVDGFLAHEAQEVVPESVTGSKDAMQPEEYEVTPAVTDEEGNVTTEAVMGEREVPDYQGIDQSKLVPLLVATIQELEARITALEA
tara:strand:+ start:7536 stop:8663 length:1128 start_codon:yes stop_codon:yes gene_type:complete